LYKQNNNILCIIQQDNDDEEKKNKQVYSRTHTSAKQSQHGYICRYIHQPNFPKTPDKLNKFQLIFRLAETMQKAIKYG